MTRNQCSSSSSYPLPGFSQLDLTTLLPPLPGHTRAPNFSPDSRHNYEYVLAALDEALQISREVEDIVQMIEDGHHSAQGSTRSHSERDVGEALQISREVDIVQMIDDGDGSAQGSARSHSERDDRQSRSPPHSGERQ
jgi:hypothetical protein